jgi:hypothetical protein
MRERETPRQAGRSDAPDGPVCQGAPRSRAIGTRLAERTAYRAAEHISAVAAATDCRWTEWSTKPVGPVA